MKITFQRPYSYEDVLLMDIVEMGQDLQHTDACIYHVLEECRDKLRHMCQDYHFDEVEDE